LFCVGLWFVVRVRVFWCKFIFVFRLDWRYGLF